MKITIDTKEDSHNDIRKVIRLLKHLIGESHSNFEPSTHEKPKPKNIFEDDSPSVGGMFSMFGDTDQKKEEPTYWEDKKDDVSLDKKDTVEFYGY